VYQKVCDTPESSFSRGEITSILKAVPPYKKRLLVRVTLSRGNINLRDCSACVTKDAGALFAHQTGRETKRTGDSDDGKGETEGFGAHIEGLRHNNDTKVSSPSIPMPHVIDSLVELSGIEPLTSSLRKC
jgi:hypothetical protein